MRDTQSTRIAPTNQPSQFGFASQTKMDSRIKEILINVLKHWSIDPKSSDAYEVWIRHVEDAEDFMFSTGVEPKWDSVLRWAFQQADDVYHENWDGKKTAKKFIFNVWKRTNEGVNQVLEMEHRSWMDYKFIENEYAKTLPDGTRQTHQVWNRVYTRVIKNGKWCRE